MAGIPIPDEALIHRVGCADTVERYLEAGCAQRASVIRALPASWSWAGKKTLDFGCGAGRALRHFIAEAEEGDFYGSDIDRPSIEWLQAHASPPFHVLVNNETPPLGLPDNSFDLIYTISVFTHLTVHWAAWLVELHRVLKPGGLLLATFMGEGVWRNTPFADEPWDADRVGMLSYSLRNPWGQGGPTVLHSDWWITERWGRLFELETVAPVGFFGSAAPAEHDHGYVLARKTSRSCTQAELAAPSSDPREPAALQRQVDVLMDEVASHEEPYISGRAAARALRAVLIARARWLWASQS
jgi:SAM-dependent methyltransferase